MLIISDVTTSPKTPGEPNGAAPAPPGVTESEPACGSPVEGAVLSLPPSCAPLPPRLNAWRAVCIGPGAGGFIVT